MGIGIAILLIVIIIGLAVLFYFMYFRNNGGESSDKCLNELTGEYVDTCWDGSCPNPVCPFNPSSCGKNGNPPCSTGSACVAKCFDVFCPQADMDFNCPICPCGLKEHSMDCEPVCDNNPGKCVKDGCPESDLGDVLLNFLKSLLAMIEDPKALAELSGLALFQGVLHAASEKLKTSLAKLSVDLVGKYTSQGILEKHLTEDALEYLKKQIANQGGLLKFIKNVKGKIYASLARTVEKEQSQLGIDSLKSVIDDAVKEALEGSSKDVLAQSVKSMVANVVGSGLNMVGKGVSFSVKAASFLFDIFMIAQISIDLLDVGGFLNFANTEAFRKLVAEKNGPKLQSDIINSFGTYPIFIGPNMLLQLMYENEETERCIQGCGENDQLPLFFLSFTFGQFDSMSKKAQDALGEVIGTIFRIYLDDTESPDIIGIQTQFSNMMNNIPDEILDELYRGAMNQMCTSGFIDENIGPGQIINNPFSYIFDIPPRGWTSLCSFKTKMDCEKYNDWVIGIGAKYGNMEWRSPDYFKSLHLYFTGTTGQPVTTTFDESIQGVCTFVDPTIHHICDIPQVVDFEGHRYYSYNHYDTETGVCHNVSAQCDLFGLATGKITIDGKDYPNCVPKDSSEFESFFIGSVLTRMDQSCITLGTCHLSDYPEIVGDTREARKSLQCRNKCTKDYVQGCI